ncbi:MAG: RNA-binding S4 domain-containing protein [Pseudomonadota bacterium]
MSPTPKQQRLDKWLWQARFFKTRTLAKSLVVSGKVRVNGTRVSKAATTVGPGDTLTFPQARVIRVIEIVQIGLRRGPAREAQTLYVDKAPAADHPDSNSGEKRAVQKENFSTAPGYEGKGRPTKKTRRSLDLSRRSHLE